MAENITVLAQAVRWLDAGRRVALAGVMASWHEGFCGRSLAVDETGVSFGTLSGGCVEDSVLAQALRAIRDGEQRLLGYSVTDEVAQRQASLECGGRIDLFVEPVDPESRVHRLLDRLVTARADGLAVALVTDLVTGLKTLVFQQAVHGGFALEEQVLCEVRRLLVVGRSLVLESEGETRLFVQVFSADFPDKCRAVTIDP